MTATDAQQYLVLSAESLRKARLHLAEGDLTQASEKGWGAAAVAVKAIAEERGLDHGGHRQIWRVVRRLADETGDQKLENRFGLAAALHMNFYENWLEPGTVEGYLGQVEVLIARLRDLN